MTERCKPSQRKVKDEPRARYEDDEVSKSWRRTTQEDKDFEWKQRAAEIDKENAEMFKVDKLWWNQFIGRGENSEWQYKLKKEAQQNGEHCWQQLFALLENVKDRWICMTSSERCQRKKTSKLKGMGAWSKKDQQAR